MMWLTLGHTVPAQCLAGEVPEGHGAIAGPGQQEGGVRRQCAHSERTAARVLQHRGHLTCPRDPHDHRAVRGAAEQVAAARAEAAAVDPVPVTRQRGEGELREVRGVVNTEGLVPGGGGQQGRREGAAAHLVRVLLQGDGQWHHLECSTLPGERFSHKVAQNAQISACDGKQGDGWRSDEPLTDSCASWRSHVELIKRRKKQTTNLSAQSVSAQVSGAPRPPAQLKSVFYLTQLLSVMWRSVTQCLWQSFPLLAPEKLAPIRKMTSLFTASKIIRED